MTSGAAVELAGTPVVLARAPDTRLGLAKVRPSICEVVVGERVIRLQPRVMQVLVALLRASGEVVSRDDLVASCWGGLSVGDDAINRCVQRLRRLAVDEAPDCFVIATLPRIGYRLTPQGAAPKSQGADAAQGQSRRDRQGGALTLAVTPFANRSGMAEDDILAFGMADDLIDAMSLGLDLRVVSSSAVARFFRNGVSDFEALHRDLSVTYVLQGSLRRADGKIQVTAQLADAQSGAIVWSQLFERPLESLAVLQKDLVLEVAAHLRAHARKLELIRALRKPGDLTAYEAAMRSAAAFRRVTGPALEVAAAEARRAVQIDPAYGLALAYLSLAEAVLYYSFKPDDSVEADRIRSLAERAITLEPDRSSVVGIAAQALLSLGLPEEALIAAERAVQLNPNNETAHMARGIACAFLNRLDEALIHFDREQAIAPNHPTTLASLMWRATVHARAENWQAARQTYDQALRLAPDEAGARVGRAMIFAMTGREEEAKIDIARARKLDLTTDLETWILRFSRGYAASPVQDPLVSFLRDIWTKAEI